MESINLGEGVIRTFSGKHVNIFDPKPEMFCIEDIAHSLAYQCRFNGHLPIFYSVAQHSVLCSEMVDTDNKFQALIHDASEAYLSDIPSPIKPYLTNYKELEDNLMKVLAKVFKFEYPLNKQVKDADRRMVESEWVYIMQPPDPDLKGLDRMECWSPEEAEKIFLENYRNLTKNK